MNLPPDDVLIARGKLSTFGRLRNEQIKRMQKTSETVQAHIYSLLADCQKPEPVSGHLVNDVRTCLDSMEKAHAEIVTLCAEIEEIRPHAWDQ